MSGSTEQDQKWQRSSIGITPLTVRPRAGQRRVNKFDLTGDTLSGPAAPDVQGQSGSERSSTNPLIVAPARPGEGEGRAEGVVLSSSSTRPFAVEGTGVAGARVCSVCARAVADYSCPRCLIGYCSSKCYKVSQSIYRVSEMPMLALSGCKEVLVVCEAFNLLLSYSRCCCCCSAATQMI